MPDLLRPCVLCYDLPPPYSPRHFLPGPYLLGSYLLTRAVLTRAPPSAPTCATYYATTYTYYATHLRVLPHAARARHGGGARAGGSVSSQRDARVIEQPPGGGDNQLPGGALPAVTQEVAWMHGCMHMVMGHQHLFGVVPDLALRYHLILLCPMPTH